MQRSRSKTVELIGIALLLATLLAGCFDKGRTASPTEAPATSEAKPEMTPPPSGDAAETSVPSASGAAESGPDPGEVTAKEEGHSGSAGKATADAGGEQKSILSKEKKAAKRTIDMETEDEIEELRSYCLGKEETLLQRMVDELSGNEKATLKTLQSKFLVSLLKAEQDCDSRFEAIVKSASEGYAEKGIPASQMPSWSDQYSQEKARVRASALAKLASAIQKNKE